MTAPASIKVVYIAGAGRSGSTILANILGQIDGFFSAGELYHLWLSPADQRLCGCTRKLSECDVWKEVFKRLFGSTNIDTQALLRWRNSGARTRYLPMLLMPVLRARLQRQLQGYLKLTESLYHTLSAVTGDRVIVDSSKVTVYACLLGMIPTIDLHVIHLVRDPRAVAFSFLRHKPHPTLNGVVDSPRYNIARSAMLWDGFNVSTELLLRHFAHRYTLVRYEDFAAYPQQTVRRLLDDIDENAATTPFLHKHEVELGQHHTVGGNPDRFRTGRVALRLDDEWQSAMNPWQRRAVGLMTWPWRLRYRYT